MNATVDRAGAGTPDAFAGFLQALGRGPGRSRHLTEAEAEAAFAAILAGAAKPEQVGAFLLLMRYRGESPEELAGMARAARAHIARPAQPIADLDWPSYAAGRSRGAPWFLLSALLLARTGVRVLMHGDNSYRGPEAPATALGLPVADGLQDAAAALDRTGFAYLPLRRLSPRLHALLRLRDVLGLRTPVNSVLRLLVPSAAPALIEGVFHPPYIDLHLAAARLAGPQRIALFKGGRGEAERNPLKPVTVRTLHEGEVGSCEWPALLGEGRGARPETAPLDRLLAVWRGERDDPEAAATVVGTAAIALRLVQPQLAPEEALAAARHAWRERG